MQLISASVAVVSRAGSIIKDIMKKGELGIVEKGLNDLQTEADRSAQRCIMASLTKQFPNVAIIGEESLDPSEVADDWVVTSRDNDVLSYSCPDALKNAKEEDVVVWVDPVDGTSEYTQGLLSHVTILIGISFKGKAVAGVIQQPFFNYEKEKDMNKQGRTMWGVVGLGTFGIERINPPENRCIVTTTRSHSSKLINSAVEAVKPDEVLRVGGAGHKILLLIEGEAHAYVFASHGCKKWDTCAPEALLHAVGGKLTDMHGNDILYHKDVKFPNTGGVLATYDASVHDSFLSKIPDEVKNALPA